MTSIHVTEGTPLLPTTHIVITREPMSSQLFWKLGAVFGATAVGLGAFGAHGLRNRISDQQQLANWSTAAQYQLIHSVALLVTHGHPVASTLFTAGITLFSGSIYALVLDRDNFRWMGPITPIGGVCLILGWVALALSRGGPRRF